MKTFDLVKHISSGKYYLLRYCIPDYNWGDGYKINSVESNYYKWSVFNDKVGGVRGGAVMKLIASRFTFKWFINLYKLYDF